MAKESEEDIFRLFGESTPRQRTSNIYRIGEKVSEDNVGFAKEELSFIEPDFTTRTVVSVSSRICDCGKLISQKNPLAGRCQRRRCNQFTCSECVRTCSRCGATFCPGHVSLCGDGESYCRQCQPIRQLLAGLKWFFDIGKQGERRKE